MSITILFSHFHVYVSNRSEADNHSTFTPRLIVMPLVITCNHRRAAMSTRTCVPGILTSVASALPLLLLILGATLGPQYLCVIPVSWNRLSKGATQQSSLVDSQTADLSHPRIHLSSLTFYFALEMLELFRSYYDCIIKLFLGI